MQAVLATMRRTARIEAEWGMSGIRISPAQRIGPDSGHSDILAGPNLPVKKNGADDSDFPNFSHDAGLATLLYFRGKRFGTDGVADPAAR